MDKLNRQILGSTNWGSSVNANWGTIEENFDTIENRVDKLTKLLETDFGVLFGGFLRFDVTRDAQNIFGSADQVDAKWSSNTALYEAKFSSASVAKSLLAQTTICISQSVVTSPNLTTPDIELEKRQFYTAGENSTVPINRVFRVVGDWEHPDLENAFTPYGTNWKDTNIAVYTGNGYRQLFWNDYIWKPTHLDQDGFLNWTYVLADTTNQNTAKTNFPANIKDSVAYKYPVTKSANSPYSILIPAPYSTNLSNVTNKSIAQVEFFTIKNSNYEPFFVQYTIRPDPQSDKYELRIDDEPALGENDYVIITYSKEA